MEGVEVKLGRNVPNGSLGGVFGCGERERAARSPIHQGKVGLGVWSSHIIDQFNCHASRAKQPGFQRWRGSWLGGRKWVGQRLQRRRCGD